MDEKLKQIADHYGTRLQLEQLIEESAELIVAATHCLREPTLSNIPAIAEEIADFEIMIEQIKYLLGYRTGGREK